MARQRMALAWAAALLAVPGASAQTHPTVPGYSSRPGAAYTVYLDFGGFTFDGMWGNTGLTPGTTPFYTTQSGSPTNFNATDLVNIQNTWARVAQSFAPFNVNVTTVDPAVSAGQAANDTTRQNYYDATAQLMHTVVGGTGSWYGNAGGTSYVDVISFGGFTGGYHTNWTFSAVNGASSNLQFVGGVTSHENGHAFGLHHQSDYSGNTLVNEYSTNNSSAAIAPIMGDTYNGNGGNGALRGTWRSGDVHITGGGKGSQNDAQVIQSNSGIGSFVDSGVGHSLATATAMGTTTTTIRPELAAGLITPANSTTPDPMGVGNYTTDYFSFSTTAAGDLSVTLHSGSQYVTTGVADPGATFKGTLKLLNGLGVELSSVTMTDLNLTATISMTNLPTGNYYLQILSSGGTLGNPDAGARYFDMGSYFLTGTGNFTPVPETATFVLTALGLVATGGTRWRSQARRRSLTTLVTSV
ncbi:MAG: hypothetical protein U0746_11655 [Gemmataceae bacterium]